MQSNAVPTGIMSVREYLEAFHKDQSGQDLLEYVLVGAAVAAGAVAGSNTLPSAMSNAIKSLNSKVQDCITGGSC